MNSGETVINLVLSVIESKIAKHEEDITKYERLESDAMRQIKSGKLVPTPESRVWGGYVETTRAACTELKSLKEVIVTNGKSWCS